MPSHDGTYFVQLVYVSLLIGIRPTLFTNNIYAKVHTRLISAYLIQYTELTNSLI